MSSAYLDAYIDNAGTRIARWVPLLASGSLGWSDVQRLCGAFRQRAVCTLLLGGTVRGFQQDLMKSGAAFAHHLRSVPEAVKITSQAKPFFDAIGAGAWSCAADIASHSRMSPDPDREYVEDFLYVQLLMKHFFLGASAAECEAILARCEAALQGADRTRVDLCAALLAGDAARFDVFLRALLDRRADLVEQAIARGAMPEEAWSWLRYFSSEGLALLRLASIKNMKIGETYRHVPDITYQAAPIPYEPDAWRFVEEAPT
ncbi:hypothetical protein WME98_02045 [Sorangium sp. So ce296]|uniref:hypothetical protein n=1 Tax=Sorangium sp. So ce296 TaxID=3133296 RepID=UPI003F5E73BD